MINAQRMFSTDQKSKLKAERKEQLKQEMLEHDYFDTEIIYDGQKRKEEDKKSEKDLLDET